MYDSLISAGLIFTAGAGVGAGIARHDTLAVVVYVILAVTGVVLLLAHHQLDRRSQTASEGA